MSPTNIKMIVTMTVITQTFDFLSMEHLRTLISVDKICIEIPSILSIYLAFIRC